MGSDVLLGAAGIIVTVVTFVVGYRQTIRVRQLRIRAADRAIVAALVRRALNEASPPIPSEVERLINRKAADFRLNPRTLRAPIDIVDVAYVFVIENDLMSEDDRCRALDALSALFKPVGGSNGRLKLNRKNPRTIFRAAYILALVPLALIASLLGTFAAISFSEPRPSATATWASFAVLFSGTMILGLGLLFRNSSFTIDRGRAPSPESYPSLREFLEYPPREMGEPALARLKQLDPFAIRNLFQLALDHIQSTAHGWTIGLGSDSELGVSDLLEAKLISTATPPSGFTGRSWWILTDEGKKLGALLTADLYDETETTPAYLLEYAQPSTPPGNIPTKPTGPGLTVDSAQIDASSKDDRSARS